MGCISRAVVFSAFYWCNCKESRPSLEKSPLDDYLIYIFLSSILSLFFLIPCSMNIAYTCIPQHACGSEEMNKKKRKELSEWIFNLKLIIKCQAHIPDT